jgi:hypothetical protein
MALKKSPSNTFDRLTSENTQVVAIECELRLDCLHVGLLCLSGSYRHQIDQTTTVDLLDPDNNFIATVELNTTFHGEKNGYFTNLILKIV